MKTNFQENGEVVLTTQEPNAILNFEYDGNDYIIIPEMMDISAGELYINGLDISKDASIFDDASLGYYLKLNNYVDLASFQIYTKKLGKTTYNLNFIVKHSPSTVYYKTISVSVFNRPYIVDSNTLNILKSANNQIDNDTSYLVLRTNPKISGNIKLVIDTKENLFFDTFKVSDILSNKLYRKQKLSANSVLSGDVRRVFSSLPGGEVFRLDNEDTLNISLPKTELDKQYNMNYSYGSRILNDELYDESFSMLSPIWINNKLPDYFALFRLDGKFNEETYDHGDLKDLATKFITNGKLFNSYSLKEKTNLGTYLRNHISELNNIIAPTFITLSPKEEFNPDPNTWYGIAIDKGIITGRSETPYFFNKKSSNFTDLTAFTTEGFERLNLLCPNLINLEYIFDDDVEDYTMHRYFGLYLTENALYNISYYAEDPDSSINILQLDDKDINDFIDSSIFDTSTGDIIDNLSNRLFTINDIDKVKRFTNKSEVDGDSSTLINEWINKPGINLFSEKSTLKELPKFTLIKIKNLLRQGEHLRVNDLTNNIIYEVYGIDSSILNPGESINYAAEYESYNKPTVRRSIFSVSGTIEDQVNAIWKAFNTFKDYEDTPFGVYTKENDGLSIKIKEEFRNNEFKFQRLTADFTEYIFDISTGLYDPNSVFNSNDKFSDIDFYGTLDPTVEDFDRLKYDSSFGPISYELYGDRMSIEIDFIDTSSYYVYSLNEDISKTFRKFMLYQADDNWYRLISNFDVSTNRDWNLRFSEDPEESNKIILITKHPVNTINYIFNGYSVYPLNLSLMGINPVKDFDTTVYDSSTNGMNFKSEYWYKREGDLDITKITIPENTIYTLSHEDNFIIESGEGSIYFQGEPFKTYSVGFPFNTFLKSAEISTTTETTISKGIQDGSANFYSYNDNYSEEYLKDYYLDYDGSTFDGSKKLKYGLTIPTNIKWSGLGFDCRGNDIRLNLDSSILDPSIHSTFIPSPSEFSDEIFYPSYKYFTPGDRNWKDYVYFDINDSVETVKDGIIKYYTFKELLLNEPYVDIFSKFMYFNKDANETITRSSITYYNNFKNTIDTILNGLNISISINENAQNTLDIQDWDRFRISAVSISSRNRDNVKPIEVIINENTKTILIIWYQGNDVLNYNLRHSSTVLGKSLLDPDSISFWDPVYFKSFNDSSIYNYYKTPFGVNTAAISTNIFHMYDNKVDLSDVSINTQKFLQLNLNEGDNLFSVFSAYHNNDVVGSGFQFDRSFDTFKRYYSYTYFKNAATYGPNVNNMPFTYNNNINYYKDKTTQYNLLEDIFRTNNIEYFILKDNEIINNNMFSYAPVKIKINKAREYEGIKTNNGWFRPMFKNILNFSSNESDIILNTTKIDFILGNTSLETYNNIQQLWYNKIVSTVTENDVSVANAIYYKEDYNPFYSQWDSGYYQLDNNPTDGYNSIVEMPSYFGSKLPKLPKELILDSWTASTTSEEYGIDRLTMKFNLTKTIINIFKENSVFINNWSGLPQQNDVIIDGYIKQTVLESYNIRKSLIKIELYTKDYDGNGNKLAFTLDNSFDLNTKANIDGELLYINNEYIYNINTTLIPELIYFVKITLFEK